MRARIVHRRLGLIAAVFCAACPAPVAAQHAGFGNDPRAPVGSPLPLPTGVELAGPLVGADDDGNCPDRSLPPVGSGLWVRVCVPVRNRSGGTATWRFPAGLVIVAQGEGFQNGILVEEISVPVPPTLVGGGGRRREEEEDETSEDVVYIPLHLYCINSRKSGSEPGAPYSIGPVVSHSALAELFVLLADKALAGDGEKVEVVQNIIYEVIQGGRLSAEHREIVATI